MCALSATRAEAQVYTRVLDGGDDYRNYVPFPVDDDVIYYAQPTIDFAAVLADDQRKARPTQRVAVKVDKDYKVKDGVWSAAGADYVWQIGFAASAASSLNFHLRDVVLPEGAELYVVSRDGRIVHGPVTAAVVYDGVYATDLIEATEVKIIARVPAAGYEKFSLRVAAVNQGVTKAARRAFERGGELEPRGWGDAEDCQLDVRCPVGAAWAAERDAVVKILRNGTDHCSGALVNDECQSFRPFVLTAFHCLDVAPRDGAISAAESNPSLWLFRFNYESLAPTCPGNTAGSEGVYLTYSGAAYRAAGAATDFALLELNGSVMNRPNLAMAGWDRTAMAPTSTTMIHHPDGDAKKISFDYQAATAAAIPINFTSVSVWAVQFDLGSSEGGSSGSPYFSQNRRIIGQHASVQSGFSECDLTPQRSAGRFGVSWTGGGTNATRLSNWLGGVTQPMLTNTIRVPWLSPANPPTGPHYICATNQIFTLQNPPPGASVSWSVTNPSLFATSSGAQTSGTGATATLRASPSFTGSSVLTFQYTRTCNGVTTQTTFQSPLWVGRPGAPVTSPTGAPAIQIGVSQYHTVYLGSAPGATAFQADWSAYGAVSMISPMGPQTYAQYQGDYAGSGGFQLVTTNVCGTRLGSGQYQVGDVPCNPCPRVRINSPARDMMTVTIEKAPVPDPDGSELTPAARSRVEVVDQTGRLVLRFDFMGSSATHDVSAVAPGLYFAKVAGAFGEETVKVVLL